MGILGPNKKIYDSVWGYVELPRRYYDVVVKDPLFHRLQHIKQMGLTYFIFPGAVHTRFAHSIGVFAIVQRMLKAQRENLLEEHERMRLELSALLHDIGHVPLSHTVEKALESHLKKMQNVKPFSIDLIDVDNNENASVEVSVKPSSVKLHELIGEQVLLNSELGQQLRKELGVAPQDIAAIFKGDNTGEVGLQGALELGRTDYVVAANFLHSQLDADRIDYLVRDAVFSGVKSGLIDFDKLLSAIRYDREGNFGVDGTALRVLEQFFMSRVAAYAQIAFNKKVHSLEYMATTFYRDLLEEPSYGDVPNYESICRMITDNPDKFLRFTDDYFWHLVQDVRDSSPNRFANTRTHKFACRLYEGKPLEVIHFEQRFCDQDEWDNFVKGSSKIGYLKRNLELFAKKINVDVKDIIIPEYKSVEVIKENRESEPLYIFGSDIPPIHVLDCEDSFLGSMKGKKLYIWRAFTFERSKRNELKAALGIPM